MVTRGLNGVAVGALVSAVPVAGGFAIAMEPRLALLIVVLVGVAVWAAARKTLAWWDLTLFSVGGLYILEYGFTNVGIAGAVPIPLVDLIAVVLVMRVATLRGFAWPTSTPFLLAVALFTVTAIRLLVDFPVHGTFALRDATLAIELSFLFVGYWAVTSLGLVRVTRALAVIFLIGLVYLAFYPVRETVSQLSPEVGLQRPVPLVGNYTGSGTVAVAAFFFFTLVRPYGRMSYALAAATLPVMALMQSRGLYLSVPAAILLLLLLARARGGVRVRRGLAATLGAGALALALFFPIAPKEGRVGELTPSFVFAQLGTLAGREGPGASVDQRTEWIERVLDEVATTPWGWAVGVGLGPDLAFGFENEKGVLVRKPHNDYLETYARLGIIGLVLLVTMLGTALLRLIGGARRAVGDEGSFLWFAVAQTVVLAFIAATQPLLAFSYGTVPLLFVLGAGLAVAERVAAVEPVRHYRPATGRVRERTSRAHPRPA